MDYRDGVDQIGQTHLGHSDEVGRIIDGEIRRLVDEAGDTAARLLTERRPELDAVAAALLER